MGKSLRRAAAPWGRPRHRPWEMPAPPPTQIGFGSGFKCNSAVWRALRPLRAVHRAWEHVEGREGEAMATLQRIAAETAAERAHKVGGPGLHRW